MSAGRIICIAILVISILSQSFAAGTVWKYIVLGYFAIVVTVLAAYYLQVKNVIKLPHKLRLSDNVFIALAMILLLIIIAYLLFSGFTLNFISYKFYVLVLLPIVLALYIITQFVETSNIHRAGYSLVTIALTAFVMF